MVKGMQLVVNIEINGDYISAVSGYAGAMTSPPPPEPRRPGYHHGNLVEALLAAAVALIEEKGVEALSVREVAKQAGVSPGAPFRHFSSKSALLTAVAEQAMARLSEAVRIELDRSDTSDPLDGLRAVGRGYLGWAFANPTHFQVVSSRSLIDFHESPSLVEENEAIRLIMLDLIERGRAQGTLRPGLPTDDLMLASRAFIYGVARMWIDGHFREWRVAKPAASAMTDALDLFVNLLGANRPQEEKAG